MADGRRRLIVYDLKRRRPACPLLQAALGGESDIANRFPSSSWLTFPTDDLHLYSVSDAQLDFLVSKATDYLKGATENG